MKNNYIKSERMWNVCLSYVYRMFYVISILFTIGIGDTWGAKGFKGPWTMQYWYTGDANTWTSEQSAGATINLGVMTHFNLKGCWVQTYSNGDWTTNDMKWEYGYTGHSASGNYILYENHMNEDPGYWTYDNKIDFDVIGNAPNPVGQNTLWMRWILDNGYATSSTCYVNFTIPGFTTTSTSQTFDNTTVNSNSSKTISFGNHYGTTLASSSTKTFTGTNASEFSVTSITESNVTVRFSPTSDGDKSATLTITDAYGNTCTITLSGKTQRTVTYSKGTYGTGSNLTDNKVYNTTLTLRNSGDFTRTGYHQTAWNTDESGTGGTSYSLQGSYTSNSAITLYPTWTANQYTITLNGNGGTGHTSSVKATYNSSSLSSSITNPTKTGYNFNGWHKTNGTGQLIINTSGALQANTDYTGASGIWTSTSGQTLWAGWTANNYTVTFDLDEDHKGTIAGKTESQSVTYDAATTTVPLLPTAENGYGLEGYYTDHNGAGTKLINGDGTWIASVDGYTDGSKNWIHDGDVTLYAYYKKAEITAITITGGATVEQSHSVTAMATISPTPVEPTIICWELQYSNGTPIETTFDPETGASVTFTSPAYSGSYKLQATLRTGSSCSGGTELSTRTINLVVAGNHNVTIRYKCGDKTIRSASSVAAEPLEWSDAITAPNDIFGYTFEKWEAGDGVTITTNDGVSTVTETTTATIKIKATYDGDLVAKYTKDNIIYFKNTLNWGSVYVNLLDTWYWNDQGSGNQNKTNRNLQMTRLGETNVWYYNYGNKSTSNYVSFTDRSQDNNYAFAGTTSDRVKVVYPTRPTPAGASADTAAYGFNAGTPMFVPQATQTAQPWNNGGSGDLAEYYNKGYWRNYDPVLGEEGATGYTLIVYNQTEGNSDRKVLHLVPFANSDVSGQVFKATVELEGSTGYGIKFKRDNDWVYTNTTGRLNRTGDVVVTQKEGEENWKAIYLLTTAAGKYDFIITCNGNGKLCLQATFPVAVNDYRVIYTDNATWTPENGAHTARTWFHPSRPISAVANAVDTVSFWVKKGASPEFKIQKVQSITEASGAVSWTDVTSWTSCNDVTATGVYNFIFTQNGSKEISLTKKEAYTGNYYIRTDNAGSTKWDNYCTEDHKMTYSDYAAGVSHSETWRDYTHYFMKFVNKDTDGGKYKNVKFVIANDYSPCISDTLTQMTGDISVTPAYTHVNSSGEIAANANVRFMWNQVDNSLKRAYLSPAQNDGTEFLVMQGEATKLLDENGNALLNSANEGDAGYNHKAPNNAIQFVDRENWMYEAKVQAMPGAYIKLYAKYDNGYFYFYGTNDATFDSSHALQLITGSGSTAQLIRVIYDFKTDRLIAAWLPTNAEIDAEKPIDADVMIIRDHQGSGQQINLTGSGTITEVKNVYGIMRFNRWTLNNKSTVNTGTTENPVHAVLPVEDQKSQYERFNYFISFPFDVKVGEIFGFGQIGRHWRIYYYDGKGRAEEGFFADKRTDNWRLVADTEDELKANEGYLLQLNYVRMADDNTSTWPQKNMNEVELYFPAKANITAIDLADVVIPALGDDYRCTIDLSAAHGGNQEANRTIKDSYWRCIGVPGFTTKVESAGSWTNFNWKADANNVPYLYEWHMDDNRLGVVSANSFTFEPMHAYLIQNGNSFTWTSVAKPIISAVVARKMQNDDGYYEFNLEVSANDKMLDRTYVRLTDKEGITTEFDFGQDLSKEMSDSYNLYTKVGYERLAANNLPLPQQTTVIPVGLTVTADGTYTFSMPEGTYGKAVTLIDNVTDERTNLGLFDYTVTLTAGDYDGRFLLEMPAINNAATGVEQVASDRYSDVRKVLIDGILYIVKGDKVFDARGAMIK